MVFTQGCPMRCLYCHNPDTWPTTGGTDITVDELITQYEKNESFYKNGGITVTGGEPLMQIEFVIELFKTAKEKGIHTCLDTSGVTFTPNNPDNVKQFDQLLAVTDLIMLDIKHIDDTRHRALTKHTNTNILEFAMYVSEKNVPIWVRHVVVPHITDNEVYQYKLGRFIGKLKTLKAIDVLPYHNMGETKYRNLGMDYPLKGISPLAPQRVLDARAIIMDGIRDQRNKAPNRF